MAKVTVTLTLFLLILFVTPGRSQTFDDEDWTYCTEFPNVGGALPHCFCAMTFKETLKVNCDGVVFQQDFPTIPPKQQITEFSWRGIKAQHIPQQAFVASGVPLEHLDLSNNNLRRLSDKALQGLGETLTLLDLSQNLLGDQLNPIFSSQEINRLPRLRVLRLSQNGIRKIDNGLLQGTLSLQEIHLDGNELNLVPSEALNGPKSLRTLNLGENLIQEIGRGDFSAQRSLVHLNLTGNKISALASGAFRELENLKILLLSWNHLQRINSDAFTGLTSLEELALDNNFLRELPRNSLGQFPRLKRLQLSANLIYNVSADDFAPLRSLTTLYLSRNRLTSIPENAFMHLRNLETLDLSVNQLRIIPKKLFHGLVNLRTLDLSDTNLLLFPMDSLHSILGLKRLHLDFNRITAIQGIPTTNLTGLSIANNLIRHIPPESLKHLVQLQNLNLHGNQLESLEELHWPGSLLDLNTSRNNLTSIPRLHLPLLHTLDVSHNHIGSILSHNFLLLPQLTRLHIQNNEVSKLELNAFQQLKHLTHLDLSGNKISDFSQIQDLEALTWLNLSSNEIGAIQPLSGLPSLRMLDLSKNQLTNLQESLFFQNAENLKSLMLAGNGLNSFRGLLGSFPALKFLSLANNKITYVFPQAFGNISAVSSLDISGNQLTFFPMESLPPDTLTSLSLARNMLRHIHEVSFSNFPRLRSLKLNSNAIETLPIEPFSNSSQLQILDLSENKIEELDENLFRGLFRLELKLASNYLSSLPPLLFARTTVLRLIEIDLSNNVLHEFPTVSLQPQIFFLEKLSLANNSISSVPPNSNVLVNVKHLDISYNPLSPAAQMTLLNEPKTTRTLNMAYANVSNLPTIEIPFLRKLDLQGNFVSEVPKTAFKRTTLLNLLNLAGNPLKNPPQDLPLTLTSLDLSGSRLESLRGTPFPASLNRLILNSVRELTRLEKGALNLPLLTELQIRDTPKLGYIDIKGILANLHFLEKIDFEVKDHQILDQIHPALSPRLRFIALRGKAIRSVSTGALAGLSSPNVQILMTNTSLTALPPILVPVPASSNVLIDISDSQILTISPPILSQNIRILGINPHCDCNAIHLIKYLQGIDSSATCASPPALQGTPVSQIQPHLLLCSSTSSVSSTTPAQRSKTTETYITYPTQTTPTTTDDIIWSLPQTTPTASTTQQKQPPSTTPKISSSMDTNAMDNLILGIVGGVVSLLVIFVLTLVCCLRRGSGGPESMHVMAGQGHKQMPHHQHHHHPQGKCTCKSPYPHTGAAATVRSHHSLYHQPQGNMASLQPINMQALHLAQQQQLYASLPYFVQYDETPMRR